MGFLACRPASLRSLHKTTKPYAVAHEHASKRMTREDCRRIVLNNRSFLTEASSSQNEREEEKERQRNATRALRWACLQDSINWKRQYKYCTPLLNIDWSIFDRTTRELNIGNYSNRLPVHCHCVITITEVTGCRVIFLFQIASDSLHFEQWMIVHKPWSGYATQGFLCPKCQVLPIGVTLSITLLLISCSKKKVGVV